jgi:N-acetylglucosamine-6-phosphate deacetylase
MTPATTRLRGTVVTGGRIVDDGVVEIVGDRIGRVGAARDWPEDLRPAPTGHTLLPGLVDVHCHGGAGHGFPEADADGVRAAVDHHRSHGTTTLLASLVSAPAAVLTERIDLLAPLVAEGLLAGIHLEGPFLSAARCGAQDPAALLPGDPALLRDLLDRAGGTVASMTLAPETPRYLGLLGVLAAHGVLPSLGHTDATATHTTAAIRAAGGVPLSATHLFNGMPPLHHRAPGPVAACLAAAARGEIVLELVGDGVHLDDATVAMVFDLVGPDRVALVTDAMAAAGKSDGRYTLGRMAVDVVDGVARLAATAHGPGGAIAGGTAHMIDVVRRAVRHAGVGLAAAVRAASTTPAALLGLGDELGDLAPGLRADVVVTDGDLRPVTVLHAGARTDAPVPT